MYTIKVDYETGDSFHREDATTTEGKFENLEIAKENLERIRIHYEYYRYRNSYSYNLKKKDKKKRLPDFIVIDKPSELICLKLKADNGNEYQIYPPWCGYFERLYSAEVIILQKEERGMKFTI